MNSIIEEDTLQIIEENEELKNTIKEALRKNNGFCPCVANSIGKEEYRCICRDMIENVPVGESCHCGLYIKDEL